MKGLVETSEELAQALDEFWSVVYEELRLIQIVDWLSERLDGRE